MQISVHVKPIGCASGSREDLVLTMKTSLKNAKKSCVTMTLASIFLVLLLTMSALHTCEAQTVETFNREGSGSTSRSAALAAGSVPANVNGTTYRPPILNYKYQGGRIMYKPLRLYFVWYGTWSETYKAVMRTAAKSLTPTQPINQWPNLSNLWQIEREFYQELPGEARKYVSNNVTIGKEVDDNYSMGSSIFPNGDAFAILASHIGQDLPKDLEQGVYFVFASGDIDLNGWASCSYHDHKCLDPGLTTCNNVTTDHVVYAFMPLITDANGLILSCNIFQHPSSNYGMPGPPPNKDVSTDGALDALVNSFFHQLFRTVVDPYWRVNPAWYHNVSENSETSRMCSYTFAAGDWYYCKIRSIWGSDFPGALPFRCLSFPNSHALVEPKSKSQFTQYGIDGSVFMVQKMWNLASKGCASQIEEACPSGTVCLITCTGRIQRGLFFDGVGLQTYAPGQLCNWRIFVLGATSIKLNFEIYALGYDNLDFVTVSANNQEIKKLTGFGKNYELTVSGWDATISFATDGSRAPYPDSAGFIMTYTAVYL